jgi:hypothetical protein
VEFLVAHSLQLALSNPIFRFDLALTLTKILLISTKTYPGASTIIAKKNTFALFDSVIADHGVEIQSYSF